MVSTLQEHSAVLPAEQFKGVDPTRPLSVAASLFQLANWRGLIKMMVYRDFVGRYKGSLLGAFWPVISPLGHMILYTFLFGMIMKVRFGAASDTNSFALYLMTGLLPWGAFAESLSRATTNILEVPNLVKKVVFPLEILPMVLVVSSILSTGITFVLLMMFAVFYQHTLHASLIFLPLVVLSQVTLMAGLSWMLASLGVFVRDFQHIMALALSAWMYATPIVYPAKMLPENFKFLLWINPMAGVVTDYRRVILEGLPPDWTSYTVYTCVAAIVGVMGFAFFVKTKHSFADIM